jgi:hypothetical protein
VSRAGELPNVFLVGTRMDSRFYEALNNLSLVRPRTAMEINQGASSLWRWSEACLGNQA